MTERFQVFNIFKASVARGKKPYVPAPAKVFQDPLYFLAFGFGSGAIPFAPGTWGTLFAIPFYVLLQPSNDYIYVALIIVFIILSSLICSKVSREIGIHDHPGMNIDEFVGFFVTMIHVPFRWYFVVLGFVLFRFFDIFKPLGIRYLDQHVHGGFGMILDDVIAGIYSAIILNLLVLVVR